MKSYILPSGIIVEPFGDPVREVLIANRTLLDRQKELLGKRGMTCEEAAGIDEIDDHEFIAVYDHLFFSDRFIKKFLKAARAADGSVVCAVKKGALTDLGNFLGNQETATVDGEEVVLYGLYCVRRADHEPVDLSACKPLVIPIKGKTKEIKTSELMPEMVDLNVPITLDMVMEIETWVHIWMLNLFSIMLEWVRIAFRHPLWLIWRLLLAFPWNNRYRFLKTLVRKGKGCRVHPTAVVEGCILGDNVTIGSNCTVQFSILGDASKVQDVTVMLGSVLGERAFVTKRGVCNFCLMYPDAQASTIQACFLGRRAFAAGLARVVDMKMTGGIGIMHKGKLVDTGLSFLGGCLGHKASIIGRVILGHGRAVPNGVTIVPEPEIFINKIPADLPTDRVIVFKDGNLVPFGK